MSRESKLRSVTNQTLFIYHYVEARGLVLRYNYTSQDSDLSQPRFAMQSSLAALWMHTGQTELCWLIFFFIFFYFLCPCLLRLLSYWSVKFMHDKNKLQREFDEDFYFFQMAFFAAKCWCRTRRCEKTKTTWRDNDQTRNEQKLPSGNVIHFVEAKNAIWSTLSTCSAGLPLPSEKTFATGVKAQ